MKHPDDYKPDQGARFEVKFDKARHFTGDDARPFLVQLIEENGAWRWEISDAREDELLEQIATMKGSGNTIQAITEKTGLTKSQVETLTKKAKERGLLL